MDPGWMIWNNFWLETVMVPRPVCVSPSSQAMFLGTRNKSTALDLRCCTTVEVGVVFLKLFRNFCRDMIDKLFF